jgi:tRNA (guanine-N7-)-methyltransferase
MRSPPPVDLSPYFLIQEDLRAEPIDWCGFFENPNPVEIEVGCGRGLFLLNAGLSQPETNFLGIEYDYKEARRAARRVMKRELQNVRILGANANLILPKFVGTNSVQAVHVYFPDPWWKRRHRKRRIFNPTFLAEVARVLHSGGLLHAWTDVEEYFRVMVRVVEGNPGFAGLAPPEPNEPRHDMDYHTSFERKKRKLGMPIYRACWQWRGAEGR